MYAFSASGLKVHVCICSKNKQIKQLFFHSSTVTVYINVQCALLSQSLTQHSLGCSSPASGLTEISSWSGSGMLHWNLS